MLAVAKENNLDIELVETKTPVQDIEYFKLNPLGRVPTFEGTNGYVLTETMAIAVYCMSSSPFSSLQIIYLQDEPYYKHSYPCLNFLLTVL